MSDSTGESHEQQSSWLYEGVWGMLSGLLCVPRAAPVLPTIESEKIVSRKPSPSFRSYMKFQFWIGTLVALMVIGVASIVVVAASENGWFLLGTVGILIVLFPIFAIAYLAIYLRYDTTWYVFSDRSMRLRRGIWLIRESTITFENIQNVKVTQGPLERWFGIANVVVETAGGGGSLGEPGAGLGMHAGLIEGVAEAADIRDSIMSRVRVTNTTGLGDESSESSQAPRNFSAAQLAILREIRDLAQNAAN